MYSQSQATGQFHVSDDKETFQNSFGQGETMTSAQCEVEARFLTKPQGVHPSLPLVQP